MLNMPRYGVLLLLSDSIQLCAVVAVDPVLLLQSGCIFEQAYIILLGAIGLWKQRSVVVYRQLCLLLA